MSKLKKVILSVVLVLLALVAAAAVFLYKNGSLPFLHPNSGAVEGQIRVACVGDSITYGSGIKGWPENSYPSRLQNMLGDGYAVNNFGYSGRTAMADGDNPFVQEKLYKKSLDFNPDIVIIMFGSNDSKPYNWKGKEAFIKDYSELIGTYSSLESQPDIYIVTPPPCFVVDDETQVKFDINGEIVDSDIYDAVKEMAEELELKFIDANTPFQGQENLYSDGVHPNREGAYAFAKIIYSALTAGASE